MLIKKLTCICVPLLVDEAGSGGVQMETGAPLPDLGDTRSCWLALCVSVSGRPL